MGLSFILLWMTALIRLLSSSKLMEFFVVKRDSLFCLKKWMTVVFYVHVNNYSNNFLGNQGVVIEDQSVTKNTSVSRCSDNVLRFD